MSQRITNDLKVEWPKIPNKTKAVMTGKANELVFFENVAHLEGSIYQVKSTSDKNKVYTMDLKDLDAHKSECKGCFYRGNCTHLKALRIFRKGEAKN